MRTEGDLIKINDWLLPLSWIYGSIVRFRNWLFDIGLKKSRDFSIPVISVGNITVGGSGKDPACGILDSPLARQGEDCRAVTWIQTQEPRICTCR